MVSEISIHNTGQLGNNPDTSSIFQTVADIDKYHRTRWPDFKSQMGYWVGYNIVIEQNGKWTQTRLLGEETAHTIGHNLTAFGICLTGNFSMVELPTQKQIGSLRQILRALVAQNPQSIGIKVASNTTFSFSRDRIYPHRSLARQGYTQCYGTSLDNFWARNLIEPQESNEELLKKYLVLLQQLLKLLSLKQKLYGAFDRDAGC